MSIGTFVQSPINYAIARLLKIVEMHDRRSLNRLETEDKGSRLKISKRDRTLSKPQKHNRLLSDAGSNRS